MRIAAGLVVVGAVVAVVSASSGSGGGGAVKSVKGPADCRSFDRAPVARKESSAVVMSVTGWIKCRGEHGKLIAGLYIWERKGGEGRWTKVGFARWGAINARAARGGTSARCFPGKVENQFAVSMRSTVDGVSPVIVERNPGQYLSGRWSCPP